MSAGKIYSLIPDAMKKIGAIAKGGQNTQQNYKFRSIDDMYNKIQPVLSELGFFFVPQVIESSENIFETTKTYNGKETLSRSFRVKQKVRYKVCASDGSFVETEVEGEAIDSFDKATNKAMTSAFKYMLIQLFCIAIEEMPDADNESPELNFVKEKAPEKKPIKNYAPSSAKDFKVPEGKFKGMMFSEIPKDELREYIDTISNQLESSGKKTPKWFEDLRRAAS